VNILSREPKGFLGCSGVLGSSYAIIAVLEEAVVLRGKWRLFVWRAAQRTPWERVCGIERDFAEERFRLGDMVGWASERYTYYFQVYHHIWVLIGEHLPLLYVTFSL
jgi:hypothetical protein